MLSSSPHFTGTQLAVTADLSPASSNGGDSTAPHPGVFISEPTAPRAQGAQARAPHPHAQTKARLLPQQAPPRGRERCQLTGTCPHSTQGQASPAQPHSTSDQGGRGSAGAQAGSPRPSKLQLYKQPPQRGTGLVWSLGAWVGGSRVSGPVGPLRQQD